MGKVFLIFAAVVIFLLGFSISKASVNNEEVDKYELPYAGILPDKPIYSIKAFRDKVVDFLISDSLKKINFNILQADKRLSAGILLFNKGKIGLAEATISKGENYSEAAIIKIKEAKREGLNVDESVRKSSLSLRAHKKYLKSFSAKSPKEFKQKFINLEKRVDGLIKQADLLLRK